MFQGKSIITKSTDSSQSKDVQAVDQLEAGFWNEIDGRGAVPVPGFIPTRHELFQLAKYWAERSFRLRHSIRMSGHCDICDERVAVFAQQRIQDIANILGREEIDHIVEQVDSEFEDAWPQGCAGPVDLRDELMEVPS